MKKETRNREQETRGNKAGRVSRIPKAWCLILAGALMLGPAACQPARGQSSANVTIDSSEQLFDVMAALNMAGYDTGLFINTGNNTRQEVRSFLARKNIAVVPQLSKFYAAHRIQGNNLSPYISLAMLLGPPPQFAFSIPEQDLPPDASALRDFVPLLRTFYRQADLEDLYARLQPRYEEAIAKYSAPARRQIVLADGYLRSPSGSYLGRKYRIYLCLLGAPDQVQFRQYLEDYYLVITPSLQPQFDAIRYHYLHFLLDPLAVKFGADIHRKAALQVIARQAPALSEDFKSDFPFLVSECLVRAVALRMDHPPDAQKKLNEYLASGLILTPYFYSALAAYEKQDSPMSSYFDQMIEGIDVDKLENELASVKFAPRKATPQAPATPVLSAKERLLNQGDNEISLAQYARAKRTFQEVLKKYDPKSERAWFGLAVVASGMMEPDIAEKNFKQTLAVAHSLRIVTWSHIYLGRIYDLEGKRQQALAQYRAASVTAGGFPDAFRAVQAGLKEPYQGRP